MEEEEGCWWRSEGPAGPEMMEEEEDAELAVVMFAEGS